MRQIVRRRFERAERDGDAPNILVIDGGKGQLSSSVKSLKELGIDKKVTIIGIAKRLEEIYFPNESTPLYIDKKSESLKLIQKLRDEAHRFSLRQYRNRRDNNFIDSELNKIDGIGEKTAISLIKEFKSVNNIKIKSIEELKSIVGQKRAKIVYDYYNK